MKTLTRTCRHQDCQAELPEEFGDAGICLRHFVSETTQKLNEAQNNFRTGFGADRATLDWLVEQVDFIVEVVGCETLALSDEQRTKLLDLLLGIANLNEHIRHATATVPLRG